MNSLLVNEEQFWPPKTKKNYPNLHSTGFVVGVGGQLRSRSARVGQKWIGRGSRRRGVSGGNTRRSGHSSRQFQFHHHPQLSGQSGQSGVDGLASAYPESYATPDGLVGSSQSSADETFDAKQPKKFIRRRLPTKTTMG